MSTRNIPLLRYGGKAQIASKVAGFFPPHRVYAEAFGGSLSVLFAKPPCEVEAVNDLDARVVNVWRQVRESPRELAALLWASPYSVADFDEARRRRKEPLAINADLLEAARQEILFSKQCYPGAAASSTWANPGTEAHIRSTPWANWCRRILPAAARLRQVTLYQEDAVSFCARLAHIEDALLYIDPPYVGHEDEYELKVDYSALVDVVSHAKAWVVISEYAGGASLWPAHWPRHVIDAPRRAGADHAASGSSRKQEIVICNFDEDGSA